MSEPDRDHAVGDLPGPKPAVRPCLRCGVPSADAACASCGLQGGPEALLAEVALLGPWWTREQAAAGRPGSSYQAIAERVDDGSIGRATVVRGPSTKQLWRPAGDAQGLAHLFGVCHNCKADASPESILCAACGASFEVSQDRQYLGLAAEPFAARTTDHSDSSFKPETQFASAIVGTDGRPSRPESFRRAVAGGVVVVLLAFTVVAVSGGLDAWADSGEIKGAPQETADTSALSSAIDAESAGDPLAVEESPIDDSAVQMRPTESREAADRAQSEAADATTDQGKRAVRTWTTAVERSVEGGDLSALRRLVSSAPAEADRRTLEMIERTIRALTLRSLP